MNLTESVYYVVSLIATVAALVLVCIQIGFSFGWGMNLAIYSVILVSLIFMLLACRKKEERPPAFYFGAKHYLKEYSFVIAGSFVAEMVCSILGIYRLHDGETVAYGGAVLLALIAAFALLSAFCFVLVGMSYGDTKYDFRRISYVSFAPLIWAMLRVAQLLTEYFSVGRDLLRTLRGLALLFLMCFFYRFAFEALRGESTAKSTLFVSGAVFNVAIPFCAAYTSALNFRVDNTDVLDLGLVLISLSASYFAIKFRRSIIDRC